MNKQALEELIAYLPNGSLDADVISLSTMVPVLQNSADDDILNMLTYVQSQIIEMRKREELLAKHPYEISKYSDGKWHTYLPDKEKGRVPRERKTKKEIEDVVVEFWKEELENPTVEEVFNEWNDRRLALRKIAPGTHQRNIQIYNRHYKDFGKRKVKAIETEEFQEFLEEQIPKYNLTAKAFSNLKTVTRGFLKRAKKRKLIFFNVEEMLDDLDTLDSEFKKVIKEDYEEVFDEEETYVMMQYLTENADVKNLGILLMFVTGIRVGELVALRFSDFEENTFYIRRTETRYQIEPGKNAYEIKDFPKSEAGVRTEIIPDAFVWIVERLKELNPSSEYVFCENGERLTTNCIRRRLERVCKKLSIYRKSPHKVRKTYGSILLDNNVDERFITDMMGHTDITCTERHYHRNRRSIEQKAEILNRIPEFQAKEKTYQTHTA